MAMVVQITLLTGGTPTATAVTSVKFNLEDTQSGTTPVPTPTSTGTNFSFIKSFQIEIVTVNSLSMTNVKVGKTGNESVTGTKLWHDTADAAYTQATAAPASTGDNNTTAPVMPHSSNNTGVTAMPLIGSASVYAAGAFNTTGRKGNIVEVAVGVDSTNTTAGSAVAIPTIRWQWTES